MESLSEYITFNTGRPKCKQNGFKCLLWRFDWRNKNSEFWTLERWHNDLARWYHPNRYTEFKISKSWKSSPFARRSVVRSLHSESSVGLGVDGTCLFVSVHRQLQILSLLYYCMQSEHRTINDCWLLMESSSCFWVAYTQAILFQRTTLTVRGSSGWIVSFFVGGFFKHSVGTVRIDNRTIQNCDGALSQFLWIIYWGCPRGEMVKMMDCRILVSEFVLHSRY